MPANPASQSESENALTTQHGQRSGGCSCYAVRLGLQDYRQTWQLQKQIVAARIEGTIGTDILLLVEHPPVFTLGRRGGSEHLLVSEQFLASHTIAVVHVERGGDITYHGPGQLVAYPIVDLEARRLGVLDFVWALEEIMLRTAADNGVAAGRNPANRGIWVADSKMGSIGIALRKGISFHGLAFNVNLDLTPFSWIQPCGLQGIQMTSLQKELGRRLPMGEVRRSLEHHFQQLLEMNIKPMHPEELQRQLRPAIQKIH